MPGKYDCVLNDGNVIPLIGLGTSSSEGLPLVSAIGTAMECGYRLFDTAEAYGNQLTVGMAVFSQAEKLMIPRELIVLSTKVYLTRENTRDNVKAAVVKAFNELNKDSLGTRKLPIGVCMLHYPTYAIQSEEACHNAHNKEIRLEGYQALLELKAEGLVLSVGVSNYEVRHLKEIEEAYLPLPAINQIEYHPYFVRKDIVEYCKEKGIFVQAFSSMGGMNSKLVDEPVVTEIGNRFDPPLSPAGVLLSYAVTQGIGVIPRSIDPKHLESNFMESRETLSSEDIARLDALNKGHDGSCNEICKSWVVQ